MPRIHYERQGSIVLITMEGDDDLNVGVVGQELHDRLLEYRDDAGLWCAVVTGAGSRAFTAGGNLGNVGRLGGGAAIWEARSLNLISGAEFWKPVIAAINGHAIGAGLMLALACDIRLAAEDATLGLTEVKLGFPPGQGATWRLPHAIALGPAMELLLTGDRISAQQALQWNLVNKVVPGPQLMDEAMQLAGRIVANPPLAVRASKELALRALQMSFDDHSRLQHQLTYVCRQTEDAKEYTAARAEKRSPVFKGR